MPYRHAHYWLLLLFPLTALAFWPNYFSKLWEVPYAFHVHGVTASLWIALLAVQSWSIHGRRNALHRSIGYSSFLLFPLFIVGGLLVIQTMAVKFAAGEEPFAAMYGARLASLDAIATLGILYLFFMALRCRRKVHLHARYMLTTVFFLLSPILGRLAPALPPLSMSGPAEFHRFAWGLHLSNAVGVLLALWLYRRAPQHGRPFLIVGGLIAFQSLMFQTLARTSAWETPFIAFGTLPMPVVASLGLAVAAAVTWAGWNAPLQGRAAIRTA